MRDTISHLNRLHYILAYTRPGGCGPLASVVNRRSMAELISVPQQRANFEELTSTGIRFGLLMASLILLLSSLSVAGVMISRFDGLKMQVAVLRAPGFTKQAIARWLLFEGAKIGLASCSPGGSADLIALPVVRALLGSSLPSSEIVLSHLLQRSFLACHDSR